MEPIQSVTAVNDKDWRNCPHCKSEIVQAVKNGFQVLKISTDLMLCHDCEKLYIVFPHGRYKGKPKGLPKPMSIAIDMDIEKEIEGMILQYKINKAMYEHIIGDK